MYTADAIIERTNTFLFQIVIATSVTKYFVLPKCQGDSTKRMIAGRRTIPAIHLLCGAGWLWYIIIIM